jgi:hypothetical protein
LAGGGGTPWPVAAGRMNFSDGPFASHLSRRGWVSMVSDSVVIRW